MMIQPVFSKISLSAIVAGAVLALGQVALAQEQVIGNAMAGSASQGGAGAQQMPHLLTGPTLGDIHGGSAPDGGGEAKGQTGDGATQDSSPGNAQDNQTTTTTAPNPVDQPQSILPQTVAPLEHKSEGVPLWLVGVIAVAALLLGRKLTRGARR